MDTFVAIVLFIVFIPIIIGAYRVGLKISANNDIKRRQRYIESGYYNAQMNDEALRRARERNGW